MRDTVRGLAPFADVGEGGDVILGLARPVAQYGNHHPLGKRLPSLAPVPDLAFPAVAGGRSAHKARYSSDEVSPEGEQARILAHDLGRPVAGEAGEGQVDRDDPVVPVGNQGGVGGLGEQAGEDALPGRCRVIRAKRGGLAIPAGESLRSAAGSAGMSWPILVSKFLLFCRNFRKDSREN